MYQEGSRSSAGIRCCCCRCFAPWLAGAALGLGLPLLAPVVLSAFAYDITPLYALADMLMLMLTPMMAGMLAGFLMLDERDERVGEYYGVTPIGGAGYLFSRLALPVLWSVAVALLLLAFAGNKVEGLAVSKMMGLILLPVVVPFLTSSPWGMAAGLFPAYWMGAIFTGPLCLFLPGLAVSAVWLYVLYRRTVARQG